MLDWNKRNGGFLSPVSVYEDQLGNLSAQLNEKDKEIERLNNIINRARRILGEYQHFTTPTEEQNKKNEDIADEVYEMLHENLKSKIKELKGSDKE